MKLRQFLQIKIMFAPILFLGFATFAFSQDLPKIPSAQETPAARALTRLDEVDAKIATLTDRIERLEADLIAQKSENQRLAKIIDENNAKVIAAQKPEPSVAEAAPKVADSSAKAIEPALPIAEPTVSAPAPKEAPVQTANVETKPAAIVAAPKPIATAPKPIAPAPKPIAAAPKVAASIPALAPAPVAVKKPSISAAQYLTNARLSIQNGELDDAASSLKSLIEIYKSGSEQLEARWLLGETYFVQNEYLDATKTYIDYLKVDKNGPRVPDVLVRLASSYRELGVADQRCKALRAYQALAKSPSAALKARAQDEFAKGTCP